ncbi:MAG: DUF438 domain-containing protein [Gammaproteobacteria bacterium]|nr:DUF438 domain-containing protein [Gammaproteobacteria bacterium]
MSSGALTKFPAGHPVRVYLEENILLRSLFSQIEQVDPKTDSETFKQLFEQIKRVEFHYVRKENQLFPQLEQHGWDSPSKNMWAFHDDNRALLKNVRLALEAEEFDKVMTDYQKMRDGMQHLMSVEEERLLPNAMQMLDEQEWMDMREGDEEIGWMLEEAPVAWPPIAKQDQEQEKTKQAEASYEHPSEVKKASKLSFSTDDMFHYDEGYMTPEQVNLLFRILPLDITYVDENDQVVFYNRGEDRLFPRSKNIIGREVRYCHPPKSVDTVLRILEEFKKGTKDVADFRIHVKGRFILIRYFAVRDNDGTYRGVMEMSQDITDIQAMEGEQRLLDWD